MFGSSLWFTSSSADLAISNWVQNQGELLIKSEENKKIFLNY